MFRQALRTIHGDRIEAPAVLNPATPEEHVQSEQQQDGRSPREPTKQPTSPATGDLITSLRGSEDGAMARLLRRRTPASRRRKAPDAGAGGGVSSPVLERQRSLSDPRNHGGGRQRIRSVSVGGTPPQSPATPVGTNLMESLKLL